MTEAPGYGSHYWLCSERYFWPYCYMALFASARCGPDTNEMIAVSYHIALSSHNASGNDAGGYGFAKVVKQGYCEKDSCNRQR